MHQVSAVRTAAARLPYAYGDGALWLSVVLDGDAGLAGGGYLTLSFPDTPGPFAVSLSPDGQLAGTAQALQAAAGRTAEFQIPLAAIGAVSALKIPIVIGARHGADGNAVTVARRPPRTGGVGSRPWRA